MKMHIEINSVAEWAAFIAIIRGDVVIDDATVTKLHALNQALEKNADELSSATPK